MMTQVVKSPQKIDPSLVRMIDIALHTDGKQNTPAIKAILKHAKILNCLYEVSEALNDCERPFSEIMTEIVTMIPKGLRHPKKASIRIDCCDVTYLSPNFKPSPWMISSVIHCKDRLIGRMDVFYAESSPNKTHPSFIPAEQKLLSEITKRIGRNCSLRHEGDALRIAANRLSSSFEAATIGLFYLDIKGNFLRVNSSFAQMLGYSAENMATQSLQSVLSPQSREPDDPLYCIFYDGPIEPCQALARFVCADGSYVTGDISLTPELMEDGSVDCIVGSVQKVSPQDDIVDREAQMQAHLRRAEFEIVNVLSKAQSHRDPYTSEHQNRVATLAVSIGRQMGMQGPQLKNLELGARIHDIGKLDIPSDILSKPGALTPQEYDLIKTHSAMGCDIVAGEILPPVIQDIILHHHERWDGSGYPDGLVGTEISLESRIVAVADSLESITSHRPYRPGRGLRTALDIIKEEKGRLLDPDVVEVCVAMGEEGYFDWLIVQ